MYSVNKIYEAVREYKRRNGLSPRSRGTLSEYDQKHYVILNPLKNPQIRIWDNHSYWDGHGHGAPLEFGRKIPSKEEISEKVYERKKEEMRQDLEWIGPP